jgi:hypothetical protein
MGDNEAVESRLLMLHQEGLTDAQMKSSLYKERVWTYPESKLSSNPTGRRTSRKVPLRVEKDGDDQGHWSEQGHHNLFTGNTRRQDGLYDEKGRRVKQDPLAQPPVPPKDGYMVPSGLKSE